MDVRELGPADRNHLARRVQLHRARAERNHRTVEREVLVGEAAQVAQHLGLAVVAVEDGVRQEGRRAAQALGNERSDAALERRDLGQRLAVLREHAPEGDDVVARRRLVERDAQHRVAPLGKAAQVHPGSDRALRDRGGACAGLDGQRVERALAAHRAAEAAQACGEDRRVGGDALGDPFQPGRSVVDRVHARDHCRQHLRRADVAGRLLAPDVLLARLQREAIGGVAVRVDADADQPPREAPLVLVAARQVGGVRAAAAHRHAEALRRSARDVGAELAGRRDQGQREQVGGDDERGAVRVDARRVGAQVVQRTARRRVLREHREIVAAVEQRRPVLGRVGEDDREAERLGARAHHLDRLRMGVAGDDDRLARAPDAAPGERHRLGGGGRLVEHRRVGDRHPGEVRDHRLEVDERLEPSLRDLGLVRRVGGVPGRVLQHVAQDDAGRVRAVVALADEALEDAVLGRDCAQLGERVGFAERRRQAHRRRACDRWRDDLLDQRAPRRGADHRQHVHLGGGVDADVAADELAGAFELGERLQDGHQHRVSLCRRFRLPSPARRTRPGP